MALGASDAAFAWSELPPGSRVVDVGGGEGHLLASILENHPHLVGTCLDRPDVAARASAYLSNVAGAEAVAGSFFERLPAGDVYVLKWILHDWDDDDALQNTPGGPEIHDRGGAPSRLGARRRRRARDGRAVGLFWEGEAPRPSRDTRRAPASTPLSRWTATR